MRNAAELRHGTAVRFWLAVLLAGVYASVAVGQLESEVVLSEADRTKLDPSETNILERADRLFGDGKYREALSEYEAFIVSDKRSVVVPYALLRMGRALQKNNKRYEATRIFCEVVDYFPDEVQYAAPALFYQGQCQWDTGNKTNAFKTWEYIAKDKRYRKHRLAAYALNALADRLVEGEKYDKAGREYLQIATDFREINTDAATHAMNQLVRMHVRLRPDVTKLREAWSALRGFEKEPDKIGGDEDTCFWEAIRDRVRALGVFKVGEESLKKSHYGYWAGAMEEQRPHDDDFQKDMADFYLFADGNQDAWIARMDKQFAAYQQPGNYDRVVKWIIFYTPNEKKTAEYYAKLDFSKMKNDMIKVLTLRTLDLAPGMAKSAFQQLHIGRMNDDEMVDFAKTIGQRSEELPLALFHKMKDADRAKMEELRFWADYKASAQKAADRAVRLAEHCAGIPGYAKEAYWLKAEILRGIGKWEEAIQAYRMNDPSPTNLLAIADCLLALDRVDTAVEQLREIEKTFAEESSKAALRIAHAYRGAGRRDEYISELRGVMRKYPKSPEANIAHVELESMRPC
jgi:TolA-binding protein